jgi:hypothetical protein
MWKKAFVYGGSTMMVLGAGLFAYNLYQNSSAAYNKDGGKFGSNSWRQFGESAVDFTSQFTPVGLDLSGTADGALRSYMRSGITSLQNKGYLGGKSDHKSSAQPTLA